MVEFFLTLAIGVPVVFFGVWFVIRLGFTRTIAALLALAVVAVEELYASAMNAVQGAEQAPPLIAFGHQLHAPAVAHLSLLVVAALAGGVILGWLRAGSPPPVGYLLLGGALVLGGILAGLAQDHFTLVIKAAMPGLLIIAGILVGTHLRDIPHHALAAAFTVVMTYKAAAAVLVTQGYGEHGIRFVLYYDSVTPTLAAAVLLAALVRRRWDRLTVWLALMSAVVLVLSPRRTPMLAMIAAAAIILVTARPGRVRRRAVVLAVALVALFPLFSALPEELRARVDNGIGVLTGAEYDDSAVGHFGDLHRGFDLAASGPFFGIGPTAPQPDGLAAGHANVLYIHNEFLHVWVGLGVVAGLAVIALVIALTVRAVRAARRDEATLVEMIAACFLLEMPAVLMFFPYLSTTSRWPLLYGITAAIVAGMSTRHDQPVAPDTAGVAALAAMTP